jgi:lysosomal acid lipase/cholesteryl ester hydrolase
MAQYDLPAIFTHIQSETGLESITYVGHSQGTSQFFAAMSTNPSLQSKINLFVGRNNKKFLSLIF